jgi:hypothetical protein
VMGGSSGGSSGGGGGSGAVSYPTYMQDWHTVQLAAISSVMATAQANSPYTGLAAYNPATALSSVSAAISNLNAERQDINWSSSYSAAYSQAKLIISSVINPTLTSPATDLTAMSVTLSTLKVAVDALSPGSDYSTIDTVALSEAANVISVIDASTAMSASLSAANTALSTNISTAIHDFSDALDTEYSGNLTPAFEGGMRDINAIMSSAFIIGNTLLASEKADKISRFGSELSSNMLGKKAEIYNQHMAGTSELYKQAMIKKADIYNQAVAIMAKMNEIKIDKLKEWAGASLDSRKVGITANNDYTSVQFRYGELFNQAVSEMLRLGIQRVEYARVYAAMVSDTKRIEIAAFADQQLEDKAIDVMDAKWDLESFQYGANLLASIGGGTAQPSRMEGSQMARIVGGALSGASAGALMGSRVSDSSGGDYGGVGALIGGIGGLIAGAS